ncbi:hypothetical protein DOTSEDRAFT_31609 [Dothistroma septosporum NZE10]|uniref:Uncharacterized protein n=1 Tax=Dothistroma septosporum (strain NZE10 / CBS 128990) TaxID=675120 RepID=N1PY57_DOTSN|nr:hypothetical protein DOTSEDRAFT_31609 [Dothistroma septosporum NZE10]
MGIDSVGDATAHRHCSTIRVRAIERIRVPIQLCCFELGILDKWPGKLDHLAGSDSKPLLRVPTCGSSSTQCDRDHTADHILRNLATLAYPKLPSNSHNHRQNRFLDGSNVSNISTPARILTNHNPECAPASPETPSMISAPLIPSPLSPTQPPFPYSLSSIIPHPTLTRHNGSQLGSLHFHSGLSVDIDYVPNHSDTKTLYHGSYGIPMESVKWKYSP